MFVSAFAVVCFIQPSFLPQFPLNLSPIRSTMRYFLTALTTVLMAGSPVAAVTTRQVYESPDGTFFENIAVRPNGHLLLSSFHEGRMYGLDPNAPGNSSAVVMAQFPNVTALSGIARVGADKYAVTGGVLNQTAMTFAPETVRVFTVDFAVCDLGGGHGPAPVIETVAPISAAPGGLNGMTALPALPHIVLSADSIQGAVYRTDTNTGQVDVAFQDDLLAATDPSSPIPLGVNGIHISGGYLYWTNSQAIRFGRVPITQWGDRAGPMEILAELQRNATVRSFDDFAITAGHVAYAGLHPQRLQKIEPDGTMTTLVDGNLDDDSATVPQILRGPTSVALRADGLAVYVTTGGFTTENENLGGQVVEVIL
ncbi:hypothetical protein F4778DRAFT_762888 [Xylariomycetidae sp. FL2044]|nr:hypothetical protein F4778DRAFT_762888 [Xylariomycetidae sp. FL2044]